MYVQPYSLVHSRNHCYHGNATTVFLLFVFGVAVPVKNINIFAVAMEVQQRFPLRCC
jgi:hypothetical protein